MTFILLWLFLYTTANCILTLNQIFHSSKLTVLRALQVTHGTRSEAFFQIGKPNYIFLGIDRVFFLVFVER